MSVPHWAFQKGASLFDLVANSPTTEEAEALELHVCDSAGFGFAGADVEHDAVLHAYTWAAAALDWSPPVATRTLYLSLPANHDATGAPAITGTAQVGQDLTADVTGINDADGLPSDLYYQWFRVDADGTSNETVIAGETAATYTLATDDMGKKVKVKVSFTDALGSDEERTSAAYPASGTVTANTAPTAADNTVTTAENTVYTFTATDFGFVDADGDTLASVKIVTLPASGNGTLELSGTAVVADEVVPEASIGNLAYTPPADANGSGYASFTFKVSDGTDESAAANTMTIDVTPGNDPATGAPTITGTAQVGQTLTAVTTGITDADGLTSPTYTYQWIRANGTEADISGANSSTYTLEAADLGKTIKVKVSFTDDAGNAETLTSAATATVTATIITPGSAGLVSNLNQLATTTALSFGYSATRNLVAQGFMTGASTGGYTLTSIEVAFRAGQTGTQLGNLTAGVWSDDGSGNPSAELFTLTKPASIVAATNSGGPITLSVTGNYAEFTAPANTTLDPSTSYHMVLEGGSGQLWSTAIDGETGTTGWSIADVGHKKQTAPTPGNWAAVSDDHAASNAMLIRVNGTTGGGTTTSSDATLSALALEDASDDSAITISPVFASGTTSYTASVDNGVDVITITPAVNESNATVEYLDSSDTEITDADSVKAGRQVSLSEGANTIKVKVTAQDDATTDTYTVVVTRNTAPTAADNTVTTAEDTAYTFTAGDFGFVDADGDTLASVKIVTVPTPGELALDGTAVLADAVVTKADIDGSMLTFTPVAGESGDPYTTFTFKVNDGTDDSAVANTMTIDVRDLSCGMPSFGTRRNHWSGTVTVGADEQADVVYYGFEEVVTIGGLAPKDFSIGSNSYTIDGAIVNTAVSPDKEGKLTFDLTSTLTAAEAAALKVHVCDSDGFGFADASVEYTSSTHGYSFDTALDWSPPVISRTLYLSLPANNPATGEPTITGTAQVGQVLTADTSPITDDDELPSDLHYQWFRVDADGTSNETEITGETAATYTLATADVGKKVKVKVSFTDDLSGTEELTSAATATVTADTITPGSAGLVSNLNQIATDNKLSVASGSARYSFAQGFTTGANPGGYTLTSIEVAFRYAVTAADIGNVTASVWSDDGSDNPDAVLFTLTNPASIDGATTTRSGTLDEYFILSDNYAVFTAPANTTLDPSTQYLVVVGGGSDLWSTGFDAQTGASGWSIANAARRKQTAPTAGSWAAQSGSHAMSIRVNGTTGGGTTNTAPTAADNTVTTAQDAAYTFTAGDFGFVDADSDPLVSVKIVTVPTPGELALDGTAVLADAVVTKADIDDDKLIFTPVAGASGDPYTTFTFKVNDGTDESAVANTMTIDVTSATNTAATGAPTITGTAQVGRTLTAGTTGIEDANGLTSPGYTYQWIRVDGAEADIASANSSTYTLVDADLGKTIKVKVSFEDDAGNAETLTSAATATVVAVITVSYVPLEYEVTEGAGSIDLRISVTSHPTAGTPLAFSVLLSTADGTATAADDYSALSGQLIQFGIGDTSQDHQISIIDDSVVESDETLTSTLSIDVGPVVIDTRTDFGATATITIEDDDTANTAPTAADNTVTTGVDTAYTFTADDFGFVDADGDTLASVKIETLPAAGALALDGTAVTADDVVAKADIDDDKLIFTPVAGASGDPYTTFTFKVNDGTVDSASAYTMTIDVTSSDPAITIVADRPTATGKMDWIHYTLSRGGDPAAELTVTVTVAGPAGNDWSLSATETSRDVTFAADSGTAKQSIQLGTGIGNIGFSESAIMSGTLTARLGAKAGYDTSDTDTVQVEVTSGPAWVIKLADDAHRFTEDGGDQNIELVATAASAAMPAPSLDTLDKSVLKLALVSQPGTATSSAGSVDYAPLASARYFPSSTCSADPNAGNVQVCRLNVTFTPVDDAEAEPDETLELVLQSAPIHNPAIHFQGPDRTVSSSAKTYTVTIVDDDFGVTGVDVTSTPQQATDTYGAWEHIELSVSFNKPVTVTVAPTFAFDLGGAETAAYQGGSGTGTLVFSYQVMPDNSDTNGISWAANALAGGAIVEMGGTAAPTRTVAAQPALSAHKVNGTQTASGTATVSTVTVTSVPLLMASGSTSADTYGVGETIEFTVTFSAAVTVTGDPRFAFSLSNPGQSGIADKLADYDYDPAASTATALVFSYTVQATDEDTDGIWVGSQTLKLDSDDRILTASDNSLPASLTHAEQGTKDSHKVDGSRSAGVNTAPTAADNTVTTAEDTAYTFAATDFGFVDTDGDTLASVRIVTLPAEGRLRLSGAAVTAPRVVTRTLIDGNNFTFTPEAGESGDPYTTFTFKVNDGTDDSAGTYTMTIDVTSAPGAPTGLTATASGQDQIDLAWTAPVVTGGSAITGYRIEVSPDGTSSSWSDLVADTASTATTYAHTGLDAATTRHYRVSAINAVGTSDPSDSADATTGGARARTDVLVGNFNYTGASDNLHLVIQNVVGIFTTGGSDATLDSIELKLGKLVNRTVAPTLKLYAANVAGSRATLGRKVATLITPSTSLSRNSFRTFTYDAPIGTSLTASTKYIFVLEAPSVGIILVETTTDPSEDAGTADGWTIDGYGSGSGTSPYYIGGVRQIVVRVNGTLTDNTAPTAADNTVTIAEDGRYEFSATDFRFADTDTGDRLASVKIVTVPAAGRLALGGATVMTEQVVTRARIDNGDLTFEPATGGSGDDYASFTFKVNDGTDDSAGAYTMTIDVDEAPDAPATPAVSAVSGSTTSLTVSWAAPANAGGPAITSYDVQYRMGSSGTWTDVPQDVTGTTTSITITGLVADTLYDVRVRATSADVDSGWSDPPGSGRTNSTTNNAPVFSPAIVDRSVAENTAAGEDIGAPVTATDADAGDTLTYTLGGTDAEFFDIVETTGQIRTKADVSYDFEARSSYTVTVTATDTSSATAVATVTISVTNVDEGGPPDAPATPTVSAVPGSITSLVVSWAAPANVGRPAIDGYDVQYRVIGSGTWTDVPQDVTGTTTSITITGLVADTWYEVQVRATNAEGESGWSDPPGSGRTNSTTNIDPVFNPSSVSRSVAENTAAGEDIGAAVTATDANNDTLTYTLGGADAASFDIVETTGQIRTKTGVSYDHEAKASYTVTVTVSDGIATAVADVTISITDVDEAPDAPATPTVSAVSGSTISLSVSWTAPANEGRPPIVSYSVHWREVRDPEVAFWGAKDVDVPTTTTTISDLVADTEYEVRVRANNDEVTTSSGFSDPWFGRTSTTLTNNAPVFSSSNVALSIAENTDAGVDIGAAVTATDADAGDTLIYTLRGTDAEFFDIVDTTGQIRTKDNVSYDFEAKPSYTVTVRVSDSDATAEASVIISITDVDEPPVAPATPTVSAVADSNTRLSVSWDAPANAGKPAIASYDVQYRASGSGTWIDGPQDVTDTTTPVSGLTADTLYEVQVRATNAEGDSGWSDPPGSGRTNNATTNNAPVFSSPSVSRDIAENTAAGRNVGAAVEATDDDAGDTLGYTLGGADMASFDIVPTTGQIRTISGVSYDHEAKASYTVTVTATDGTASAVATVTISITDVAEAPDAPATPTVLAVSGSTTSLTVSWIAPANAGKPAIASYDVQYRASGSGTWIDGPQDVTGTTTPVSGLTADTEYQVQVRATNDEGDSGWSDPPGSGRTNSTTNNAPVFSPATVDRSIAENTAAGQDVGAVVTATDADGDPLTYTLGGADMASFGFVGITGQIRTKAGVSYDHEARESYTVTVTASDGTATAVVSVTISITDVDEPPVAPATPTVSAVVDSTTSLSVSWAAPANVGKPAIDSYDVQYRVGSSGTWTDGPQDVTGTTTPVTGLFANTPYQARVRATNAEGDSGWSSPPGSGRTNALGVVPTGALVSNTGQANSGQRVVGADEYAQPFDTGNNSGGYSLTGIVLDLKAAPTGTGTLTITVRKNSSGKPVSNALYTLVNPALAAGLNEFMAPENAELDADTTYWVVATYSTNSGGPTWYRAVRTRVDAGAAAGWAIDDPYKIADRGAQNWEKEGFGARALQIAVKGAAIGATNNAPAFATDTTSRSFTETVGDAAVSTAGNVGAVVTATDTDTGDTLTYSLEGTDGAKFGIVSSSGQIRTKVGENYDREAKDSYSVTVKADDGNGGSDTIAVTINVDNEVEKPLAPAIPTVTATSGSTTSLDVSWTAPVNIGRPAITGYKVEYRPGTSGNWINHPHTGTGTTATIAGLTAATPYQVHMLAVNSDGDGAFSSPGAGTTGTPTNTAPTVANVISDQTATVGTALNYAFPADTFNDADTGDTLTYTATKSDNTPLPSWLSFAPATRTFSGTPQAADVGTVSVKVTASDGNGGSVSDTFDIVVSAANNHAPVFATDTADRSFTESVGDELVLSQENVGAVVTATDADSDTLTYSLEGTDAAKFSIVSSSGQIRTKVGENYDREAQASYSVTVKADDLNGGSDTIAVTINVDDAEEKPVAPAMPAVTATSGSTTSLDVSWTAPANTGRPAITGYKVEYRPGTSGNWINHPHTGTGTTATIAGLTAATAYQVQVLAVNSDGDGAFSSPGAGTTGTPTNTAPTVANVISDQTATVGTALNYAFPANTFNDADSDPLTYTATKSDNTPLPSWLSFAPATRTFSGTPQAADVGTVSVKVTASDGNGGSVSATFDIVVSAAANNAPAFSSLNVSRSIAENTAAGRNVGDAVEATDDDAGDTLIYTLGGADMASFDIVGTTGQIRTKAGVTYDHEAKPSYTVTVTASDGTATAVASVTIRITDVAEPPDAPATPTVSAVSGSTTSLSVSWAAPANAGKPAIDNYDVQYRVDSSGVSTDRPQDVTPRTWSNGPQNVTTTTTTVTGLDANTRYQARVRATNAEGDSGWSDPPGSGRTNALGVVQTGALVSNTGRTNSGQRVVGADEYAQPFDTGNNTGGYSQTGIVLDLQAAPTGTGTLTITVRENLRENKVDSPVRAALYTLVNPAALAAGLNEFMAPGNAELDANTTYWVVATYSANSGGPTWYRAVRTRVDAGAAAGWAIDAPYKIDGRVARDGWVAGSRARALQIAVKGAAIGATNNARKVATAMPDQTATVGTAFSYEFPANRFADTPTYTATQSDDTALPSWLTFTAATRMFSGTPAAADVGTVSVKVTASDGNGGSVSDTFDIVVSATVATATATRPDAPASLGATAGDEEVTLSWTPPGSDGGAAVEKYQYRYSAGSTVASDAQWMDVPDADSDGSLADERSVSVTELGNGSQYAFELRAVNGVRAGAAATATATPAAPRFLVSNFGQPVDGVAQIIPLRDIVGVFTTGEQGATLGSIEFRLFSTIPGAAPLPSATLYRGSVTDTGATPDTLVAELAAPDSLELTATAQTVAFTAPGGTRLVANTTYLVELSESAYVRVASTNSPAEDAGGASGWTIDGVGAGNSSPWSYGTSDSLLMSVNTAAQETASQQLEAPVVEGAPVVGEAGTDGAWTAGETVEVKLTFSEPVTVDITGGTPSIDLRLGTQTRSAAYTSGSGTNELVFGYTLAEDEGPHATVLVPGDSLVLNGGTIVSAADGTVDAVLAHVGAAKAALAVSTRDVADGLTAYFSAMPAEHDGDTPFTFEVHFSEAFSISYLAMPGAFEVTNGSATGAGRVDNPHDEAQGLQANKVWAVTVQPDGAGDVGIELPATTDCEAPGAVCTDDGKALAGSVEARIAGPVAISVADASVTEGAGAVLAFEVTLDRARSAPVTVDYATGNGTATAGEDYVAQSGDLTFAAGETAKTVEVEVLDDLHDEGTETMTLTLSNPSGARIADATATGSIENSDPMPQAWMVRFGRTVGSQVVDALGQRLEGGHASYVTVAGVPLTGSAAPLREDEADDVFGLPEWAKRARREQEARTITADDLRLRSAFHLSSGGGEAQGPAFTTWGRVSTGGFSAQADDVTTDGDVTTGLLGFDAEWDHLLAGVMLSRSTGEGAYRLDPGQGTDRGTVESDLTGVYPYARINLDARASAWALAGAGSGSITLKRDGRDAMKTDLSMRMGALGVKGQVLDGTGPSGMRVNLKSDAMWVGTKSAHSADMKGTQGDVLRLRLVAQGERDFVLAEQGTLTPSAELGLRHDGGDAETGVGVEFGAGLRYMVGSFTIEARARTLVAHQASGYEEWGASAAVRLAPSASGRGLSVSIAPTWGRTGSASEWLWSARDMGELEGGGGFEADGRIEAQLGYGFALPHDRGLLTPYFALTLGSEGGRTMRGGAQWLLDSDLAVTLDATRTESAGAEAGNDVRVQAALRF